MIDNIENLRREAYPDIVYRSQEQTVMSIFGHIPWEIIYSFDVLPVRSYGIDYYVVETERPMCSMLNSTVEYQTRSKCPFMAVSKYFIVDDYCPLRTSVIDEFFDPVYHYTNYENLISFLENYTKQSFDETYFTKITKKSSLISQLINQIQHSNLLIENINKLTYYSQFIFDLDKRIDYLKQFITESGSNYPSIYLGQIGGIDHHFKNKVIYEGHFCEGERHIISDATGFEFIKEKYVRDDLASPEANVNDCVMYTNNFIEYKGEIK